MQTHPKSSDVCIYNYTQACQYSGAWDEVTTRCRGLIIDWRGVSEGNEPKLLSNPLPKFFNYEEHIASGKAIPDGSPLIYEKMDGWLGILYWLDGEPWIATRGSFTSTGAIWATEWFRKYVNWEGNEEMNTMDPEWTHLFEIISPGTKIVVNYHFEGLIWLTARHLRYLDVDVCAHPEYNVNHLNLKEIPPNYGIYGIVTDLRRAPRLAEGFDISYEGLRKLEEGNKEGFVMVYPDGTRLKIKFEEYKRLHKIITGLSAIGIWEMMRDGKPITFDNVPDEFFKWVTETQEKIRSQFHEIFCRAMNAVGYVETFATRKQQAIWLMKNAKDVSSVAFAILDKEMKKAVDQVYKMIRPHGASVFKKDDL